jgi:hypothetical protein
MDVRSWFWDYAIVAVAIYCIVQAVRDIRSKRYLWAIAAAVAAALLLSMPVRTHSVVVDLPTR